MNDFYSTNIFDVHAMAEHILNLNIDKRLRDHDYSLVDDISNVVIDGKRHHFYLEGEDKFQPYGLDCEYYQVYSETHHMFRMFLKKGYWHVSPA